MCVNQIQDTFISNMKTEIQDTQADNTYSKRSKKKRTHFQTEETGNHKLVDEFVQDVIERAKCEYLRQCTNHHGDGDVVRTHSFHGDNEGDMARNNGDLLQDESVDVDERLSNKRKHNYKYSAPVDEKEIAAYQQKDEEDTLLELNPNFGRQQDHPRRRLSLYDRTVSRFRSLLGSCLGKT